MSPWKGYNYSRALPINSKTSAYFIIFPDQTIISPWLFSMKPSHFQPRLKLWVTPLPYPRKLGIYSNCDLKTSSLLTLHLRSISRKENNLKNRFNLHRCASPHWLDGVPGESGETKVKETPRALWVKNLVAGRCARNVKSCLSLRLPALFTRREAGHVYQQKLQRFITVIISNRGIFVTQDASADWLHIRGKCWRITLAYHDYSVWIYAAVHS